MKKYKRISQLIIVLLIGLSLQSCNRHSTEYFSLKSDSEERGPFYQDEEHGFLYDYNSNTYEVWFSVVSNHAPNPSSWVYTTRNKLERGPLDIRFEYEDFNGMTAEVSNIYQHSSEYIRKTILVHSDETFCRIEIRGKRRDHIIEQFLELKKSFEIED